MESNEDKPDRKPSRREMKTSKSSTLPPGAALMSHQGDGLFTKIRKCLRLRSKGKYDLNHAHVSSEADGDENSAHQSKSSSSPVKKHNERSSPQKISRRARSDKEEVILIRKDQRNLSGAKVVSKSVGATEDVLVVTIGEDQSWSKVEALAGATAVCISGTENKENDEVFEEFDPDYETLDDIRRKMRSQIDQIHNDESSLSSASAADHDKTTGRQPLQVKMKTNFDLNGQDSGLGSPFTDSPGSSRESQMHSATNSVFDSFVVSSSMTNSNISKESKLNTSSVVFVNEIPPSTSDIDPMITSATSLSCSTSSAFEEDDLYSNAKVLIRKKSKKQSQSNASLCTSDQHLNDLVLDQPKSARTSLSPADFLALMEAENPAPHAPPPLPARNYSEEDISAQLEKKNNDCPHLNSAITMKTTTNNEMHKKSASETYNHPDSLRQSWLIEHGVPAAINSVEEDKQENSDEPVVVQLPSPDAQDSQVSLSWTNNIYEDIPARFDIKQNEPQLAQATSTTLQQEGKKAEDDLMFIDEDLSVDGDCHTEKTDSGGFPEDVMIVSASDSLCGNDTDDSQACAQDKTMKETKLEMAETAQSSEIAFSDTVAGEPYQESAVSVNSEQELVDPQCGQSSTIVSHSDSCLETDVKGEPSTMSSSYTKATPAAPLSFQLSVSSSSSQSSLSSSSSDTLNLVDEPDPDDFEGKDYNPPLGPSIHITHQQLMRHIDARERGEELSSVPAHHLCSGSVQSTASARNARSMEIPSSHFLEHEEEADTYGNSRRHSSSGTANNAHRDFIESMKQLKDCGWYWGPLSYEEAENKLSDKCDGSFLVRDSSNENYILSLSFKSMGNVHHTRIEHHKGLFSFWSQPDSHGKAQICQFIEQTVENSKNGRFLYFLRPAGPGSPPLPIQLLYPISRFFRVPSLQHMCRFLVLRRVRRDHIDSLPLPQKVKGYLLEKQYYVETLDED